jgi:hypothetical protein
MPKTYENGDPSNSELTEICRHKAAECRRAAEADASGAVSIRLMQMAKEWDELAGALVDGCGNVAELKPFKRGQWKLR